MGRPQPDNREQIQGGPEEDCMAILNNLHEDGLKWHDIACSHRKPFICEDSDGLQSSIVNTNPSIYHDSGYRSTTRKNWMESEASPPHS